MMQAQRIFIFACQCKARFERLICTMKRGIPFLAHIKFSMSHFLLYTIVLSVCVFVKIQRKRMSPYMYIRNCLISKVLVFNHFYPRLYSPHVKALKVGDLRCEVSVRRLELHPRRWQSRVHSSFLQLGLFLCPGNRGDMVCSPCKYPLGC